MKIYSEGHAEAIKLAEKARADFPSHPPLARARELLEKVGVFAYRSPRCSLHTSFKGHANVLIQELGCTVFSSPFSMTHPEPRHENGNWHDLHVPMWCLDVAYEVAWEQYLRKYPANAA